MSETKNVEALYNKHRPRTVKGVVGQPEAISIINGMVKQGIPHALMLTGQSGVGKTTLCRALAAKLECGDHDLKEINCSDFKGIEMVREIRKEYTRYPVAGPCRVYILDEAHEMTNPAQNAMLKILEDEKPHVYFMIATTDPAKMLPTVKTRCKQVNLKAITPTDLKTLVVDVAAKEKIKLTPDVIDKLIECAGGSARQILNDLEKIAPLADEDSRVQALMPVAATATAMVIVNCLIPFNPKARPTWAEAAKAIMGTEEDLEKVRQIVLSCAAGQLAKTQSNGHIAARAYLTILAFADPFFHSRKAGMLAAAWQVFGQKG